MPYDKIVEDIKKSLDYWDTNAKRRYGSDKKVKRLYATWHCLSNNLEKAAKDCGLIYDPRKEISEGVLCFHSWAYIRDDKFQQLEKTLETWKKREAQK